MHDGRVMPHRVKCGQMLFRCSCRDSHRSLVCTESTAVSMLFDATLKVPDDERAGRVKARVQDKLTNPFNADKERKKREKAEKVETDKAIWDPVIERADEVVEDSFAGMAAKEKPPRRKLLVSPPPLVSHQQNSDGEVSRRTTRRERRSTCGRTVTRCIGTSTRCVS